ncbi:hypothetical protein L7F22_000847 [Adiantum nelumboides]|nr:hypothetical protein [Adiantum nelumboides]
MTTGETCALPGCSKPPFPSPSRATTHLTCGNLHHQLLMAARFHQNLAHPHQEILDRNAAGHCALPTCCDPPDPGHSWCSQRHFLTWLSKFTSLLHPDQICKRPGCTRHVFVDEKFSRSQFCGWRHCQEHVMLVALQNRPQQLPQQERSPSPLSSAESKCGHVPSLESLVPTLRDYAFNASLPRNIQVDKNFFDKHPWDICTAIGHECLLIVRCIYTSKGKRVMLTTDNYHWKQQGRPTVKKNIMLKYFTYKKRKGKQNDAVKHDDGCSYFMEECTVEDVKNYGLVKLHKKSATHVKQSQRQPATRSKQSVPEVCDPCSSYITSPTVGGTDVDSSFWGLDLDELLDPSFFTEEDY